jgi:autotransporter-associated beta strand protein/T5SS/PEP-CTERM-associated repeat protein
MAISGAGVSSAQTVTVYGTAAGQSGPAYPGGSIAAGDTVQIDDGGSVTGNVANSGTLQFNQTSGSISLSGTYTGSATSTLSLTNSGTVGVIQTASTTVIDGAVTVQAGRLSTGTSALIIGATGNGSLSISGNGAVATTFARFASGSGASATFTISGGTFTNTAVSSPPFFFASGTASSGTFTMTGGTAALGNGSGGGFAYGTNSTAVMNLLGGTCNWSWVEPAEGGDSVATITVAGSAARLIANQYIRMSLGSNSVTTMTVNSGVVDAFALRMGSGVNSISTLTVTGGSAGFNGTGATINSNFIGGAAAGSSGTATFTGGTISFGGPTNVGGLGTINGGGASRGMLKVEGGLITSNTATSGIFSSVLENHFILGRYAPTTGELVMTGGTFNATRDFYVGGSGTGTLTLSGSGGRLQVGRLFVSSTVVSQMNNVGGTGSVTVSSGTLLCTGSGAAANLLVGTNATGTGSLTINGSGYVTVGGTLTRGSVGAITLDPGGTLQIGSGTTGGVLLGGTGSLLNNGTLVFNRSNTVSHAGLISGSGSLVKRGAGLLTLTGSNTYTGLTTVQAGTLSLSGSGAIGSGGLSLAAGTVFDISASDQTVFTFPAGSDLTGLGTISGSGKTLAVLGDFSPGSSPGTFFIGTGVTLDLAGAAGSTFEISSPAYTAGSYDLVSGQGNVVLGGPLTLAFSNGPYAAGSNVLQLFTNAGLLSGSFSSVSATGLEPGQSATYDASTGYVSIVPEPSSFASLTTVAVIAFAIWRNAGHRHHSSRTTRLR